MAILEVDGVPLLDVWGGRAGIPGRSAGRGGGDAADGGAPRLAG